MPAALNNEIVQLFEEGKLTPEQIAEDTGLDLVSIKAALIKSSTIYREMIKHEDKDDNEISDLISDDELKEMVDGLKNLARFSEVDGVRLKAICRVIDEKKGRLNPIKEIKNASFNLILFNQQLLEMRRKKQQKDSIDV